MGANPRVLITAPIGLTDDGELPTEIVVHQVGEWEHWWFGKITMTRSKMNKMVKNHRSRIAQPGAPIERQLHVDVEHKFKMGDAVAWVDGLQRRGDQLLFTGVRWNSLGEELLRDERYLYISSEYYEDYYPNSTDAENIDEETGQVKGVGPLMIAAGLTNRPFITELPSIMNSDFEPIEKEELDDKSMVVISLTTTDDETPPKKVEAKKEGNVPPDPEPQKVDLSKFATKEQLEAEQTAREQAEEEVKQLRREQRSMRLQLRKSKVNEIISKAKERGVPPFVCNTLSTILVQVNPESDKKLTLTVGEDEREMNLFESLSFLLEKMPVIKEGDPNNQQELSRQFEDEDDLDNDVVREKGRKLGESQKREVKLDTTKGRDPSSVYGVK